MHPNPITAWKKQLRDSAAGAFETGAARSGDDMEAKVNQLHAKIGEPTMEWDFLERRLGRFDQK